MKWKALLPPVAACLLLAGCHDPRGAVEFNNQLTRSNAQLQQGHQDFFDTINRRQESADFRPEEVRVAHERLIEDFDRIRQEAAAVEVPDTPAARAFHEAQQRFLAAEERIIRHDYRELVEVLLRRDLNAVEQENQLQEIAERVRQAQDEAMREVQEAQEQFAGAYGLLLE